MDQRKSALIEALAAKCAALLELLQLEQPGDGAPIPDSAASDAGATEAVPGAAAAAEAAPEASFEQAFRELRKWVDTAADDKVRRTRSSDRDKDRGWKCGCVGCGEPVPPRTLLLLLVGPLS